MMAATILKLTPLSLFGIMLLIVFYLEMSSATLIKKKIQKLIPK